MQLTSPGLGGRRPLSLRASFFSGGHLRGHAAWLATLLAGAAAHAQPALTGNAEADFVAPAVVLPDPNGVDVGMPLQFPEGTVSGNDLKDIRFQYDAATDKMYVAFNTYGIATDVDADGDAGRTGAVLAGLGGTDFRRISGTESFALLIDIDEDGIFDVTAGVEAGTDIDAFAVAHFAGNPLVPSFAFGAPVAGIDGVVFSDPEPGAPDLEFSISGWSTLPTSGADRSTGFRVNAFLGSFSDAGIGEDFLPGIGETVRVCQPTAEVCNDLDDDCDGQVDEGFDVGSVCRAGIGACGVQGVVLCQPNGQAACTATPGRPEPETCDGADNDCDGTSDEGIDGACTSNLPGLCAAGHLRCENAALRCEPNNAPTPERCDTQDNDCDGGSDEGLPVGQLCGVGEGACRAVGIYVCDAHGGIRCTGTPRDPHPETCDNIDNDCDGETDEDFNLGDVCSTGVGACRAAGEIVCDEFGSIACTAEPGEPAAEQCNGEDDDCDNSTDEGLGLGERCGTGVGACRAEGALVCDGAGGIRCSAMPGQPGAEACNGQDDDCDNTTDEGFGLGTACTEGVGACADAGQIVCDGNGGATCDATPGQPGAELCNGADDNCNGVIDEDFDLGTRCATGVGACRAEGAIECDGNGSIRCTAAPGEPSAELCNGIDDDCDNSTDEGLGLGDRCGTGVGACRDEGEIVCGPEGSIQCNAQPGQPVAELCNGIDDDCDNSTDEGLGLGDRCGTGVGACRDEGEIVCGPEGSILCNAQPRDPIAESCNGIDDDCDNSTDEGLGLGDVCREGVGACAAAGTVVCAPNGGTDCSATPGAPGAEVCNASDDDCDGSVDEGLTRACGSDVGQCRAGVSTCVVGEYSACEGEVGPAPEVCNGWDDDCDGTTDEGFDLGRACDEGVGACSARGILVCNYEGGTMCNAQPRAPRAEACDNIDNDCDGTTDEALTRACGSDVGACSPGVSTCVAGQYGACEGAGGPTPESCNGVDDNCNGTVDEDFGLGERCATGVGACRDEGVITCAPGGSIQCDAQPRDPIAETCNGIDDDCDNSTDEGFGLGTACTEGVGACADAGQIVCDGSGGTTCDAEPGRGGAETCNNTDDDCDGSVDEGLTRACGTDEGQCTAGVSTCVAGQYGACEGEVGPAPEVCNGWDDDCDGTTDEGFDLGRACNEGVGACGARGILVCNYEGGTMCNAQPGAPRAETCDNIDNDCDGTTDEALTRVCGSDVGACEQGVSTCVAGRYGACEGGVGPTGETCNGQDDNCDGTVDEGFGLGDRCGTGVGACRGEGEIVCAPGGGIECNAQPRDPAAESCNGQDDDCDNSTDEGLGLGDACTEGVGACADAGQIVCDGSGGTTCDAEPGRGGEETCNNTDDDCDGLVDEDLTRACGTDEGQCSAGVSTCVAGQYGACEGGVGPAPETCNGTDDDCDGATDEGFDLGAACSAGEGACQAEGEIICAPGGGTTCNAQPVDPTAESCNGADDDCDRQVDEGFELGGACVVGVGACQAEGMLVCGAGEGGGEGDELIVNGSFENPVLPDAWEYYFDEGAWPGWVRTRGTGTELQQISTAFDGNQYAELDADSSSCIAQTVATQVGQPLTLSLAFSARTGVADNAVEVLWNGDVIAVLNDSGVGRNDTAWQVHTFDVVAIGPESVVEFCDASRDQPTLGGFIDAVSLRGAGAVVCDAQPGEPGVETCNGIDDDCDGATDEDFALGEACRAGQGACGADGVTVCGAAGDVVCNAQPIDPTRESCNGTDDDCDGSVDEGFGLGRACHEGVGTCAADGVITCDGQGGTTCDAAPGAPGAETCDALDNDCDGSVDEQLGLGDACTAGTGACAADGVRVCDAQGGTTCNAQPRDPLAESCNGTDDDCDGSTDEGFGLGEACHEGVGACAADGVITCDGQGGTACSAEPAAPGAELCDDLDNDCDGTVDEGFGLGDVCHAGTGLCRRGGERVCDGNGGARCDATAGHPADELCDEEDNDCDGRIDEDFGLQTDCAVGLGACRRDGVTICGESDVVAGLGGNLLLNGSFEDPVLDADWRVYQQVPGWTTVAGEGIEIQRIWGASDGRQYVELDSHPEPGAGCMMQTVPTTAGAIYRLSFQHSARPNVGDNRMAFYWDGMEVAEVDANGIGRNATHWNHHAFDVAGNGDGGTLVVCDVTGDADTLGGLVDDIRLEMVEGILCDAVPGEPTDERCDGIDNDCDGYTDEDLGLGQACSTGVGACAAEGVQQCNEHGDVVCTAQAGDPQPELCDELDNDCDGETDEEGCDVECDGQARTQTPGGWGARANGNNPGAYRDRHFAACFPRGLILGDQEGIDNDRCHALVLTTSAKVERFLPNGGGAAALRCDELDPASSATGVLSNHLAAAMLSVGFDRCDADFGRSDVDLGDFVVSDPRSPCHGWTVDQVITEGNLVISGCGGRLRPTDIAGCLALINENFVDGVGNNGDLVCDGDDLPPVPPPPAHQQCD